MKYISHRAIICTLTLLIIIITVLFTFLRSSDVPEYITAPVRKGDHTTFVKPNIPATGEFKGVGFLEAPRGMLSHWMVIKDGIISNYQAVVPSTWNSGPRNFNDDVGPYEQSLVGTPVADPNKPLEVVRTIHSFDPCMACAVHVVDADGNEVVSVKVL